MNYIEPTLDLLSYEQVRDMVWMGPHDDFAQQELDIRLALHKFLKADPLISDILYTDPIEDTWHPADVLVLSAGTWVWVEAKGRTYRLIDKDDWMIDLDKIDRLRDLSQKTKMEAAHVTITADQHCLLWSIDAPHTSKRLNLPVKSYNKARGMANKTVCFYSTATAQELK